MKSSQLGYLFFFSLLYWTIFNSLLPLLPVYAADLGADQASTGYFMAFAYLAMTLGTLASGWLSDRLRRRKELLVVSIIILIPSLWAIGQARQLWQLAILTAVAWFALGAGITLTGIIAAMFADDSQRGRVFGILTVAAALGGIVGGLAAGPIADAWGYSSLFLILAIVALPLLPVAAWLLEDRATEANPVKAPGSQPSPFGVPFYLLVASSVIVAMAVFMGFLGRSITMDQLGFSSSAITSTVALPSLLVLPVGFLAGRLSDRSGRRPLLMIGYLIASLGLGVMLLSVDLWQFWVASTLISIMAVANGAVGPAYVTDLVPPASFGRGLSIFNATPWFGAILGFSLMGIFMQTYGAAAAFTVALLLPLLGIGLLAGIRAARLDPVS